MRRSLFALALCVGCGPSEPAAPPAVLCPATRDTVKIFTGRDTLLVILHICPVPQEATP